MDIGLGLKINIFNIYNMIIDYDIQFISFDLLTVLTGMVFMSNPDEVEYNYERLTFSLKKFFNR